MEKQQTLNMVQNKELKNYLNDTGLNLDRFVDIEKLLGISLLTQSYNRNNKLKGKITFAVNVFPSLYSCNDHDYERRVFSFIKPGSSADEFSLNRDPETISRLRTTQKLGAVPKKLAESYKK
jgi:hypothetical protein